MYSFANVVRNLPKIRALRGGVTHAMRSLSFGNPPFLIPASTTAVESRYYPDTLFAEAGRITDNRMDKPRLALN